MNHSLAKSDFHDKGLQNCLLFFSFSAYLEGIKVVTSLPVFLCFCCKRDLLVCLVITGIILFCIDVVAYFTSRLLHAVQVGLWWRYHSLRKLPPSLVYLTRSAVAVGAKAYVIPSHAKLEKEINKAPVSTCHSEELQVLCEPRGSTMITGTHTQSTSFKISSFFTYPITHLQVCWEIFF